MNMYMRNNSYRRKRLIHVTIWLALIYIYIFIQFLRRLKRRGLMTGEVLRSVEDMIALLADQRRKRMLLAF